MNLEEIRLHCLSKTGTTEEFPFNNQTLVFKVFGKAFLLTNIDQPDRITVKCDPELAIELREKYDSVTPGYHMNKKHWNTVLLKGNYSRRDILSWIDHSYERVCTGLPGTIKAYFSTN
jgi:predicted DNA-binding protein (MmcQ/YjbR family)